MSWYYSPIVRYGGDDMVHSCMSVRFNSMGSQVLALRRRLPPILYDSCVSLPICQFYHPDYYNSCTMKSCCFAGEKDEYVLSGSDDFNLYVWKVADLDCMFFLLSISEPIYIVIRIDFSKRYKPVG